MTPPPSRGKPRSEEVADRTLLPVGMSLTVDWEDCNDSPPWFNTSD